MTGSRRLGCQPLQVRKRHRLRWSRSPPISCSNAPELRQGLEGSERVFDALQSAREPRRYAAQDVLRLLFWAPAFGRRGMVKGIPLADGDRQEGASAMTKMSLTSRSAHRI